ncbi:SDR family oxidoreductase [Marinobacter sp. JSM 1782161]|uniref:SDR family oxidoreductase n=1 Tax=Marinobacter sp. JSM 1782161 TaxID=2685906 RepID=UPI00140288A2|nr:SDR family oxidoreductase [Marinobacter sp. JSM 1782161]
MERIVIAGVSGGIGKALAEALLDRDDVAVIGLCREPARLSDWAAPAGERLTLLPWDAGSYGLDRAALPGDLELDGVIYAAGILHGEGLSPEKRLEDLSADSLLHAYQVNAVGFPMLVQSLLPYLRHKRLKRLMAISAKVGSIGDNGFGGWYAYRASKAALNMLVKNLSVELPRRARPVTCVAVHPGTTRTELSAPFQQSLAQLQVHDVSDTAANLLGIYDGLAEADNGAFLSWDGSTLPW